MGAAVKTYTYVAPLPKAENLVMNAIAALKGPATVHQIYDHLKGEQSMAALYTLCRRLEKRGMIEGRQTVFDLGALGKATRTTYVIC